MLFLDGPASIAPWLAVGVERPEVFAVSHPYFETAGLGLDGTTEGLNDLDAAFEVGGATQLVVDIVDPVILPHRTRHFL